MAVAERIGGVDGYNLLLASVKSSLRFSFLNGASSYAGFCVRLLIEHYKTSHVHKNMKMTLFSTPHNDSDVNFGLDTAREIDHRIAKNAFDRALLWIQVCLKCVLLMTNRKCTVRGSNYC